LKRSGIPSSGYYRQAHLFTGFLPHALAGLAWIPGRARAGVIVQRPG
jgi:hypothetical protein